VLAYLAFSRSFEITYDPSNVVSLDVNENNVTMAVFRGNMLVEVIRVETSLGRIVQHIPLGGRGSRGEDLLVRGMLGGN
jgi:hypothetical protein